MNKEEYKKQIIKYITECENQDLIEVMYFFIIEVNKDG